MKPNDSLALQKHIALLSLALLFSLLLGKQAVFAQNATPEVTPPTDSVTQSTITYGQVVEETLTQSSSYDGWLFYGAEGDHIVARMVASNGLAPLLGIVDGGGDLIARSDVSDDNVQTDAPVNGVAEIDFMLPATGEYTLVPTRVGNENGTTTGSYSLVLTFVESTEAESSTFQEVTFRCGADEIVSAATLELNGEPDDGDYQITVYGLDGFSPYIRVDVVETGETLACSNEAGTTTNQQITLPGDGELTVDQQSVKAAQLSLSDLSRYGVVRIIVGSVDGAAGRFYTVIEGAALQPAGNFDRINLRPAPRARDETLLLYMLKNPRTRIDPQITYVIEGDEEAGDVNLCDDAGRFACEQVSEAVGYSFPLVSDQRISGDSLSAGIEVQSPDLRYVFVQMRSRSATTTGAYTTLLIGQLPALIVEGE